MTIIKHCRHTELVQHAIINKYIEHLQLQVSFVFEPVFAAICKLTTK